MPSAEQAVAIQPVLYLVFFQGLHHQRIILPELSKQLAPVGGPFKQGLTCSDIKNGD